MLRFILLAASVVTLSSCYQKDDYTCVCRTGNAIVQEKPLIHMKRENAKSDCQQLHDAYQPPAGTQYLVYTECTLK